MQTELKKQFERSNIVLNIGPGGLLLGSCLIAVLSRFPSGMVGQPLWLLNVFEIIVSFALAGFGFVKYRQITTRITSSVWKATSSDLSTAFVKAKYERVLARGQIRLCLMFSLNAPFNWPGERWPEWAMFGRFGLIMLLCLLIIVDTKSNAEVKRQYEQTLSKEERKENNRVRRKGVIPLLVALLYCAAVTSVPLFPSNQGGLYWKLEPVWVGIFLLLATVTLIIQFGYAWRVTYRTAIRA